MEQMTTELQGPSCLHSWWECNCVDWEQLYLEGGAFLPEELRQPPIKVSVSETNAKFVEMGRSLGEKLARQKDEELLRLFSEDS